MLRAGPLDPARFDISRQESRDYQRRLQEVVDYLRGRPPIKHFALGRGVSYADDDALSPGYSAAALLWRGP